CRACLTTRTLVCPLCSSCSSYLLFSFFFNDPAPTEIYTLSLHDALPICAMWPTTPTTVVQVTFFCVGSSKVTRLPKNVTWTTVRSEEHTSELQSLTNLVCRLLLEKKKKKKTDTIACRRKEQYSSLYHTIV